MDIEDIITWAEENSVSCRNLLIAADRMARKQILAWLEEHDGFCDLDDSDERPALSCIAFEETRQAVIKAITTDNGRLAFIAEVDDEDYWLNDDEFTQGELCQVADMLKNAPESFGFHIGDRVTWDDPTLKGKLPEEELEERRQTVYEIVSKEPEFAFISNEDSCAEVPYSELHRTA